MFLLTRPYIFPHDLDVFVSVVAILFMVKSKNVKNFMNDNELMFATITNGNMLTACMVKANISLASNIVIKYQVTSP